MLYALKLALVGLITVVAAVLTILFAVFDRYGKRVYAISRLWTRLILAVSGVRLRVTGVSRLDPCQHYIFMANHESNLDIPVLVQSLIEYQLRWLAKKELVRVPFFGWAMWAGKHVIVDRSNRSAALGSLNQAKQLMNAGVSLVIFPEGTRSSGGRMLPFKKGGFLLALKTRTPIVPITIRGSGAVLARGTWQLRKGTVGVAVHAAIPTEKYRMADVRTLSDQVREVIAQGLSQTAADHAPSAGAARRARNQ